MDGLSHLHALHCSEGKDADFMFSSALYNLIRDPFHDELPCIPYGATVSRVTQSRHEAILVHQTSLHFTMSHYRWRAISLLLVRVLRQKNIIRPHRTAFCSDRHTPTPCSSCGTLLV